MRDPGPGNLGKARKHTSTTRYGFFFDAVKDGMTKRFAHKWRETTQKNAEKKLRADYRKRGYAIDKIYGVVTDLDSILNRD